MSLGSRIALIVALQTVALIGMVGMKQYTLATGVPVVLKTQPIDPRSLFSGDYVRLNYAISSIDLTQLGSNLTIQKGDTVYVLLIKNEEYWEPVSVHRAMPPASAGVLAIKGKVEYLGVGVDGSRLLDESQPAKRITVKYGIENYFVPEGEGLELERPKPGEVMSIRVVIDKYGNPAIKAVLINGVERYVEKVF